jgi:DNA-binding transcriptional ArsR family regulator
MGVFVEPMRLQIIRALLERGKMNVKQLTEHLSSEAGIALPPSTISRHLKILLDAGYLTCTESGPSHFYAMKQAEIQQTVGDLLAYTGLPQ